MKVLFIAGWFPQNDNYTGIFVKEHALAVAREHKVAVIHGEKNSKQENKLEFSSTIEDGMQILRFTYRKRSFFSSYPRYIRGMLTSFEKIISSGFKPDIIHANIYFTGIPANIIGKKHNIPYVITEHYSGFQRKTLGRDDIKNAKKGMENAKYILPVSNALKEDITAYGIDGNFEIVPNTVPDIFHYAPDLRNKDAVKKSSAYRQCIQRRTFPIL